MNLSKKNFKTFWFCDLYPQQLTKMENENDCNTLFHIDFSNLDLKDQDIYTLDNISLIKKLSKFNVVGIDISGNKFKDISWINDFKNIRYLNISDNKISDINCIFYENLEDLDCRFNRITDLDVLLNNNSLEILDCSYNSIASFEVLKTLKNLKELICFSNECLINIDDFKILKEVKYDEFKGCTEYSTYSKRNY